MAEARLSEHIQWHEGMLLAPQHFQQESARVDALVGWQTLAGQPAAWGVRRLEVDEALLGNGLLRITAIEAILPDGMAVHYDAAQAQGHPLELDLAPYRSTMEQQALPVYLAVGSARSLRLVGQPARFRRIAGGLVEDEVSEALAEEVPRMAANLALMAGTVPGAAYVSLQLMQLLRENEAVRRAPFWPAQLTVAPQAPLLERAKALAAQMRSKALFLARQSAAGSSLPEERLALLELRSRLASLTLHLPLLEAAVFSPMVQPLPLYLALCAQLGPLAALRPGAVPLAPPVYVHADSHGAFEQVLDNLEDLAGEVSQEWRSHTFRDEGRVFALPIEEAWLGARLVVGLRGQDERGLQEWMERAVIGSRTVSTSLAERRVPGAARWLIDGAPELGLRGGAGWSLFAIEAAPQFIVAGQDLLLSNLLEHSQTGRPREVVLFVKDGS